MEKNPANGGIATSARLAARNASDVFGSCFRSPPILYMSCSPWRAWMMIPAVRKSVALKKACVIRWKRAFAYAPIPAARNM